MQFSAQSQQANTPQSNRRQGKSSKGKKDRGSFWRILLGVVVIGIVVVQLVTLYFLFDIKGQGSTSNAQILQEVSVLTNIDTSQDPTIALVSNADNLKSENTIHQKVYADAQDGDYVIGFEDKMLIYRRSSNEIIYEGKSPGQILQDTRASLSNRVIELAKESELIPQDTTSEPQISVVTDVETSKKRDPEFYENLASQDVVAIFNSEGVIIIYRSDTDEIVNSGSFQVAIN